jgi:hypothetical protein
MRWLPLLLLALALSACSRNPTYGTPPRRDSTRTEGPPETTEVLPDPGDPTTR